VHVEVRTPGGVVRPRLLVVALKIGGGMDNVMDGRLHIIGKANQQTKDFTARQQDIRAKMQGGSTGVLSPESLKNYFDSTPAGFYVPKNWVWGS